MSSVVRPSGPLPPRVYWVRRLLLVVAILLVVLLVWWLVGRVFGGSDPAQAAPQTPTTTVHTGDGPANNHQQTQHHRPGTKGNTNADPSRPCDPTQVAMTVSVKDAKVGAATPVRLSLTSTGPQACTLAITPSSLALRIMSHNDDVIWSSDTCPDQLLAKEVVVRRDPSTTYTFTWDGHEAEQPCSAPESVPKTGTYDVEAALIGAGVHTATFDVT